MTRKDLGSLAHDHRWGLGIIGLALSLFAGSFFIEDLKQNALVMAIVTAVGGLVKTWLESQTKRLEEGTQQRLQATLGATNETIDTTLRASLSMVGEAIRGIRSDLDQKHEENQAAFARLNSDKDTNERRFSALEEGHKELKESHSELRDSVLRIESKVDAAMLVGRERTAT
jgi:hypothetical protein